jgi:hypothetical protein
MYILYPHQEEAVDKLRNGSVLWGGVGTGKSLTAAVYYMKKEFPKNVYVITTAKKRDALDWEKEFVRFGIGRSADGSVGGVLTVDSWNNIGRYQDVTDAFFIFDEQRIVGAGEWSTKFIRISRRNSWILLSATPGDTWLDYIPLFVANGYYKNRTEFKREHVVYKSYSKFPKVERYLGVSKLIRQRNAILVEMPYLRHTVRKSIDILVDYDRPLFDTVVKRKWNVYESMPLRGVAELFLVMRKVVNSSPSRVETIRNLILTHPRLIVFYNFDFELEALRSLVNSTTNPNQMGPESWQTQQPASITSSLLESPKNLLSISNAPAVKQISPTLKNESEKTTSMTKIITSGSTFQLAEYNGHKHEAVPIGESWVYLVQYAAGAEGWNCTSTDAMVFYSLPYSYKLWEQAHGRIDRLNTPYTELFYYSLKSDSLIDKAIAKCLDEKRNFNESSFMGTKWDKPGLGP